MWMTLLFKPFSVRIAAAVVLKRLATVFNVSPFFTVYFVRKDGTGVGVGFAEGDAMTVGVGVEFDAGVPLGANAAVDGPADGAGLGPEPPESRVRATTANASTIRPTRASWPGARTNGSRVTWSTRRGCSSRTGAVRGSGRRNASAAAIRSGSAPAARLAWREERAAR